MVLLKKIITFFIVFLITFMSTNICFSKSIKDFGNNAIFIDVLTSKASFNGNVVSMKGDKYQVIYRNDRMLIPVRFISEAFGANVKWDEINRTVEISSDRVQASITVGGDTVEINGQTYQIDIPAEIINERVYLPLRYLAEKVYNKQVYYKDDMVAIGTDDEISSIEDNDYLIYKYMDLIRNYDENPFFAINHCPKSGYIDQTGKVIIQTIFEEAYDFQEGLALVKYNGKYGFIDKSGNFVIQPQYDEATSFEGGLSSVMISEPENKNFHYHFYINYKGEEVDYKPYIKDKFSEDLAPYGVQDGNNSKWGFIDRNKSIKIDPIYDLVEPFSDGVALVEVNGLYGYIDNNGQYLIKPQFISARSFSEGLAAANSGHNYGLINKNGEFINDIRFRRCDLFKNGLAFAVTASDKPEAGYINRNGEFVWKRPAIGDDLNLEF